jgi:mannose-6-phosphate isomerase-like protein (cupin superfamily)
MSTDHEIPKVNHQQWEGASTPTPTLENSVSRVWYLRSVDNNGEPIHEQRVEYFPGSPFPPTHYHPDQDEHFEIEHGVMLFVIDGTEHVLGAGDTIEIPRGTLHKARNASNTDSAVVRWETRPALRTAAFFTTAGQLGDDAGPLDSALLAREYRDVFVTTGLVGLLVPVVSRIARLLGRKLPTPPSGRT